MNKSELKKILKPLIKQCIKEVIFEEGTLSNIVSEVARGLGTPPVIAETRQPKRQMKSDITAEEAAARLKRKRQMLDSIGKDAYNGVDLFEGTTPAPPPDTGGGRGALAGVDPNDPGVDINRFASSKHWKTLAGAIK